MELIKNKLIPTNGRACEGDIELITKVLNMLDSTPTILQLGAGENFTLAIFKERPHALLYSVDIDQDAHNWETKAMEVFGMEGCSREVIVSESAEYASQYKGPKVDLLIIDADHSYEGVLSDLKVWEPHMNKDCHYVFCHDYDAEDAPYYYEGVEKATKEFFGKRCSWRGGWSAVWRVKD